jgi:hypothetical protein
MAQLLLLGSMVLLNGIVAKAAKAQFHRSKPILMQMHLAIFAQLALMVLPVKQLSTQQVDMLHLVNAKLLILQIEAGRFMKQAAKLS